MTGTDFTKIKVCLAVLACQFSEHCQGDDKFTVEQIEIVNESEPELSGLSPVFDENEFEVEVKYLNTLLGLELELPKIIELAKKCGFIKTGETDKSFKV